MKIWIVGLVSFAMLSGCGVENDSTLSVVHPLSPDEVAALPGGSGELRFHMTFDNHDAVDLDLHVRDPGGEHIYYSDPHAQSGGELDIDCMCGYCPNGPSENIYWRDPEAERGVYQVWVEHFEGCVLSHSPSNYTLWVLQGDEVVHSSEGTLRSGQSKVFNFIYGG